MPVLAGGVAIASIEALLFQKMSLVDLSSAMWNGYVADTGNEILDSLLSRGGVMSVAELIMLLFAALTFAGIIEKIEYWTQLWKNFFLLSIIALF